MGGAFHLNFSKSQPGMVIPASNYIGNKEEMGEDEAEHVLKFMNNNRKLKKEFYLLVEWKEKNGGVGAVCKCPLHRVTQAMWCSFS